MAASNPTETRVQRRLIREFIDADPADIVIMRPTMTATASGGRTKAAPAPLAPQRLRLVPFKRRLVEVTRNTPDGDIINLPYVLVGPHDADVRPGDHFVHDGKHYDVISLEPNTSYRVAANVTFRGPAT